GRNTIFQKLRGESQEKWGAMNAARAGIFAGTGDEWADFCNLRRKFIKLGFRQTRHMKMRHAGELAGTVSDDSIAGECFTQFTSMLQVELTHTCNHRPSRRSLLHILEQAAQQSLDLHIAHSIQRVRNEHAL